MTRPPRTRAAAVVTVLGAVLGAAGSPAAVASPGQDRGNGVATVVLRDVVLTGIAITGATDPDSGPDGGPTPVVRLTVATLSRTGGLDLVRPEPAGSTRVRAGAPGPSVTGRQLVLDATWACVDGLGITEAGLLSGLLDDPLNEAFDVDPQTGFEPTWVTALANFVGSLPVPIVIDELRAEVAGLRATELQLPRAQVNRGRTRVAALPGCGRPSGTTVTPEGAVRRLDDLPELRDVPDAAELRGSG
ncbi:MAG: hypothetical protein ACRCY8_08085 [Dermatophilaceae bacterium]